MPAGEPRPLLTVDGPFLLYRSFFAMPETLTGADERPIGALLGAANVLLLIAAQTDPRAVVVCWGAEAAHYRVELYPGYHAHRPPTPDPLAWQFEQAPAMFAGFGWESAADEGYEADDVMHSLALAEQARGGSALIATGDRDMYQSASEAITVLYLKMGKRGYELVDPDEVRRRYGIGPELVPDFIALRGDPSDGLPGAPGIGPKTATELLRAHGSLEAAIDAARGERPRVAAALREHADALRAYKRIATLADLRLDPPPDRPTDLAGGAREARRLGMNRLAERLEQAKGLADLK